MHSSAGRPPAQTYIEQAQKNFHEAAARGQGVVSRRYAIAGKTIQFNIGTAPLERLITRGLAHLATENAQEPDLTVFAWDSESTGAAPLLPAWDTQAYGYHGLISGFNDARFHAAMQLDPHILRLIDFEQRQAIYWMPTARDVPVWEAGAPLRPLLHEWLRHQGLIPVHGGAIGTMRGGVFLAGAGGSGKSNLALSCLNSPLLYASDDFCVLSAKPWTAHSLYNTGKIAAADMVRHPYLMGKASNPDRLDHEKALFFLWENFPDKLISSMPLKAILLPRVVDARQSELIPASPATAQKAIAMSTIQMSRSTADFTFRNVAEFVRALPCYELRVGSNQVAPAALIMSLLADLT